MTSKHADGSISRRRILAQSVAGVAAAALGGAAQGAATGDSNRELAERRESAIAVRSGAAQETNVRKFPHHPTNGDEENLSPKFIGNFCKGLPQSEFGEVDESAYEHLLAALASGDPESFEQLPLGKAPKQLPDTLNKAVANGVVRLDNQSRQLSTTQPFYRTQTDRHEMLSRPNAQAPRFYRLHSERAATPDGISKLVDPQAGLALDLEGPDSHSLTLPPPPKYNGEEIVAEICENYWMALLRDTPFSEFDNSPLAAAAAKDLTKHKQFKGPRDATGAVTTKTLFRGTTPGDLSGPYVSQFLLREVPFGAYKLPQMIDSGYNPLESVFLNTHQDWYLSQLGLIQPSVTSPIEPHYNFRPRELCNYVHIDELFQGYLNAALILAVPHSRGGLEAPLNHGNPYTTSATQVGFGTLGQPNFSSMVAEVATRALKAVWYQKWFVHRRLRPEAFAGHIHFMKSGKKNNYPLHPDALTQLQDVLEEVQKFNAKNNGEGYFLPMAFRDGCPSHPAYGAGHATVAGACVTVLKAIYEGSTRFSALNPDTVIYVPTSDGKKLCPLKKGEKLSDARDITFDQLADGLTIEGELNKLASNVSLARNFAGVHWRSDHAVSLVLGEEVAIQFLKEVITTYNERVSFNFNKFDGTAMTISN